MKPVDVISDVWKSTFLVEIPRDVRSLGNQHHSVIDGNIHKRNRSEAEDIIEKTEV